MDICHVEYLLIRTVVGLQLVRREYTGSFQCV
nr:MAG TPA: hypothetical protein [Herelleviridae sp.]